MIDEQDLQFDDFSVYIPEKSLNERLHDLELWKILAEMQGIDTRNTNLLINDLQHQIKNQTIHNILSEI